MRLLNNSSDHLSLLSIYEAFIENSGSSVREKQVWCKDHALNFKSIQKAIQIKEQLIDYMD